jgi:DNA primase
MPSPDFKTAIETIRDHNEITEVIGSYVQLKKAGNSIKACCPFHKEKTPSFHVNPSRQSFHCFGCSAGGDVFNFIMRHENMDFMQAAKFLAERANLEFEFDRDASSGPVSRKDDLLRLHVQLRDWYQRCLKESSQAGKARAYLAERELDGQAAETFGIGFAPARDVDWPKWAASRKFDLELLVTAGVLLRNEDGGWYDRFNDRLMFPIQDESGRVIGFSGRLLPGDTRNSKYVNSPETPLFTKSKVIYALHHAKREILDRGEAILCEGQIDVIRCHLAGIKHAVAAQGTAITENHARILRRFTDTVRLVLDSDEAGKNAAIRSSEVLIAAGLNVRVASLPPGDDPDSFIRRSGGDLFLTAVESAIPALEFQIDTLLAREKSADDAVVLRTARTVLESIARAPSDIQRDQLIQRAAARLGLRPDILIAELRSVMRRSTRATGERDEPQEQPAIPVHPLEELELIRLLVHYPQSVELLMTYIDTSHLNSETCRKLFTVLTQHAYDENFDIMAELPPDDAEARRVVAMLSAENRYAGTEFDIDKTSREMVVAIRKRDFDQQRRRLETQRRTAEGDTAKQLDLEITELSYHLHTLRSGWDKAKMVLDLHRSLSDSQT